MDFFPGNVLLCTSVTDLGSFSNVVTAPVEPMEYEGAVIECPKITSSINRGKNNHLKINRA